MLNDLKRNYEFYYIQYADGRIEQVPRARCFALAESPTEVNPYKQRWFAVPDGKDGGYIIRLPRNAEGEKLYRQNEAMRQYEKRLHAEDGECLWKDIDGHCDKDCKNCCDCVTRTVPLDKPVVSEDESALAVDLPSDEVGPEGVFLQCETASEVSVALDKLPKGYGKIIRLRYLQDLSTVEIAELLGCSKRYVNLALQKAKPLLEKLLKDFAN